MDVSVRSSSPSARSLDGWQEKVEKNENGGGGKNERRAEGEGCKMLAARFLTADANGGAPNAKKGTELLIS